MKFRKDFMAQMYENPQAAPGMFGGLGKRGSSGSTKQRFYDTYEDAKDAGLIPYTNDPIEIGIRYANSIKDFVASREVVQRGLAADVIQYFDHPKVIGASGAPEPLVRGGPPPGWMSWRACRARGNKSAYAPDDFADHVQQFLRQGFPAATTSAPMSMTPCATRPVPGPSSSLASMPTTCSPWPTRPSSGPDQGRSTTSWSATSQGIEQILKSARWPGVTMAREGKRFQTEYLDPNSTNPIATIMAEANARPIGRGHAADYKFQDRGSFINKFSPSTLQSELQQAWKEDAARIMPRHTRLPADP